jgi:hypothetical protein
VSSSIDPSEFSAPAESAIDVSALGARLASPLQPKLAEARGAVEGATSGEEAWRRLFEQGLVSDELYRSSVRGFAVANTERTTATAHGDRLDLHEVPATVEAAVTLASDAAGVLEAERLARVLRTRLVPWRAKAVDRIEWIVLTHRIAFSFRQGPALNCALYSLEYVLEEIGVELRSLCPDLPWLPRFVNDIVCADAGWTRAVAEALDVPGAYGSPSELVGEDFDTLENPFRTVLQLWGLGYVLDYSCNFEVSTARLYTYAIDAPQNLAARLREQARARGD